MLEIIKKHIVHCAMPELLNTDAVLLLNCHPTRFGICVPGLAYQSYKATGYIAGKHSTPRTTDYCRQHPI